MNHDEIYLNDVVMEKKRMEEESEMQPSLQIEKNINVDEGEKRIKDYFLIASLKKKVET